MNFKVIVHQAEEGGFWAEVPAILGCASQGETYDELIKNVKQAIEACLSVDIRNIELTEHDKVVELSV